ncbi:MAG TPA: hypothetical protein VFK57_00580 [Vicinamibacterales bacterium]|nr:hypothetical protein [Vicinamibacterales bacterium]
MDSRLASLLTRLQTTGFTDLAGSESYTVVRLSERLLNEAVAAFVASSTVVRTVTLQPRASNQIDVQLKLAKPSFLPAFSISLHIDQQPQLPEHPELVLRMTGAGGLLRLAGPALESSGTLPHGIRLEGDRLRLDVRRILQQQGRAELLDYIDQLHVLSEESRLVLAVQLRVR